MLMMQDFSWVAAGCSSGWFRTASGINTHPFTNNIPYGATLPHCASAVVLKFTRTSGKIYFGYLNQ
jgi:hypothetical protein